MMTTKIQKWGNSLAIRLPKALFESGKFSLGTVVSFEERGSEVIIRSAQKRLPTLKEALKGAKSSDFEPLMDWGPDVGEEIIRD
jgi:antitoxin MazE